MSAPDPAHYEVTQKFFVGNA